jgi:integrase
MEGVMRGKPSTRHVGNGERKREVWYVEWEDELTGRRRQQTFKTKAEAQVRQDEVNKFHRPDKTALPVLDADVTLAEFAAEWIREQISTKVWARRGTIGTYTEHLRRVCAFDLGNQPLGDLRVRDLKREHAKALVTGMRKAGFAPSTTRLSYLMFSQVLDHAVSERLLPTHPVDRDYYKKKLRPHFRTPKGKPKALTEPQAQQFLAAAREHSRLFDLFATGFLAGLRVGELTGLQLGDDEHDVERRVRRLHIQRTLLKDSTKNPVTGPTKSGESRHVDVAAALGRVLDHLKAQRPKDAMQFGWRPVPTWAFVTSIGRPVSHSAVRQEFARVLKLVGLDGHGFTPHSMRHSFATTHIDHGCNAQWLRQQMGHASIQITYDLYGNWFKLADAQAADAVGDALLGNERGNQGTR